MTKNLMKSLCIRIDNAQVEINYCSKMVSLYSVAIWQPLLMIHLLKKINFKFKGFF